MNPFRLSALVAALAVPFAASAQKGLGLANSFNAFVLGSASLGGSHASGSVAIGGALAGSYDFAQASANGSLGGQTMGLYVKGSVAGGGSVNNGRSYTGTYGASMNFNGGARAATTAAMDADFDATAKSLKSQASQIASLAGLYGNSFDLSDLNRIKGVTRSGTSIVVGDSNNLTIDVTKFTAYTPVAGQSVILFNLNADSFEAFNNMQIAWNGLDGSHTLLVNVTSNDDVINWVPKQQVQAGNHYALYNFATATSLTVGSNAAFNGSILAPTAAVTQKQNIQGNLIAGSWTALNSPELHFDTDGYSKFLGWAPTSTTQAVPEPGAWAALGLGAAAMLRRRRR